MAEWKRLQIRIKVQAFEAEKQTDHGSTPEAISRYSLFDLIPYVPVNTFSVISEWVFLGWTSTKQGLMCLAQGHNTVTPVRLEPLTPRSQVKYSTTEPLRSHFQV